METFLSLQIYVRNINFYFKLSFLCIIRNNLSERVDFNLPFSWDCVKFLGVVVMMCQGMRGGGEGREWGIWSSSHPSTLMSTEPSFILFARLLQVQESSPFLQCSLGHKETCFHVSLGQRKLCRPAKALVVATHHILIFFWGLATFLGLCWGYKDNVFPTARPTEVFGIVPPSRVSQWSSAQELTPSLPLGFSCEFTSFPQE